MKTRATMRGAAGAAAEITDAQATRTLAVFAGVAMLAGPRRTRPVAGFLYGLMLSRAHGAAVRRLQTTIARLFDERHGALRRIDELAERVDDLCDRVDDVEDVTVPRSATSPTWARVDARRGQRERERIGAEVDLDDEPAGDIDPAMDSGACG